MTLRVPGFAYRLPFDMSLPTARELLEHLRKRYEAESGEKLSDEALVAKLPISGSTLARWKKGDTNSFSQIVEMLAEAGWLSSGEARPVQASPRNRLAELEAKMDRQGAATTETLRGLEAQLSQIRGLLEPRAREATEDPS